MIIEFINHFKRIEQVEDVKEFPAGIDIDIRDNSMFNKEVTEDHVFKCISKLKNNKAAGTDNVIDQYIKSTKHILCLLYVKLFNKVLETENIPEDWLTGIIVPIYKKVGEVNDVNNYRDITQLSCLDKLFTTILNERLTQFYDDNHIIKEMQASFRQGYSTTDHVVVMKNLIDLFHYKKKNLFCLFIYYSKAFDLVWRDALRYTLLKVGINGKVIRVIKTCIVI